MDAVAFWTLLLLLLTGTSFWTLFFRDFLFLSSLLTFYQFSFAYFQHLLSETLLDLGSDYKVKLSNCVSFLDLFIYFWTLNVCVFCFVFCAWSRAAVGGWHLLAGKTAVNPRRRPTGFPVSSVAITGLLHSSASAVLALWLHHNRLDLPLASSDFTTCGF